DVLKIDVRWSEVKQDPWFWDPWREERTAQEQNRVYERIPLESYPADEVFVSVLQAEAIDGGKTQALAITPAARIERDPHGHPVLHLIGRSPRPKADKGASPAPDQVHVVFEVRPLVRTREAR